MTELTPTGRVILGMIAAGHQTGYDIKQLVDDSTRYFWAASYGQIYPELRRLEQAGLVEGRADPDSARGRTVYRLTPAGRRALREWLGSSRPPVHELRDEGLLKLFFGQAATPQDTLRTVRAMRQRHEEMVERLREIEPLAASAPGEGPSTVLDYGLGLHRWSAEWCRRAERRLAGGEG